MQTTLLLADDDTELSGLLKEYFESEGFQVRLAPDGIAALEEARKPGLDLIVLDVMMPGINGIELCERLRQSGTTAKTPIVMLSAKEDVETQRDAIDAGANIFVPKTKGIDMLMNAVNQLLV